MLYSRFIIIIKWSRRGKKKLIEIEGDNIDSQYKALILKT